MEKGEDRPNHIHWPPIIYVAVLVAAWLLQRLVPSPVFGTMLGGFPIKLFGWLLVPAGLGIGLAGILQFRAVGTTVDPTGRASTLASGGIYAYSRNPMYVGVVITYFGLALALGSIWLLILTIAMIALLRKFAIEPEEAYLSRRFGADYAAYRARVRRWL